MTEPMPSLPDDRATMLVGVTRPSIRIGLFCLWLAVVAYLAAHHVFWRDEVRAFNLALAGDDVVAMARAVHGEGHPLLWYLLLRAAHVVVPVREVLPVVGLAVGVAGAGFFAGRAPFRPFAIAVVLFGGWMAFDYIVMARNYGISMLLMFVIADRFARRREDAVAIGGLLFLLCNTNVPSVIVAGGFLLFWLVEIVAEGGWRWRPALARWLGAAALCLAGVIACFLTVYPPFNEAAVTPLAAKLSPGLALAAMLNVGAPFSSLWPEELQAIPGALTMLTLLVVAGPFSLLRRPGGTIAAGAVLPALLLFFQFVYPGGYRHQALYLCFLVALHWMAAKGRGGRWSDAAALPRGAVPRIAGWLLVALLALQPVTTASLVVQHAAGRVEGQGAALAQTLDRHGLGRALVIADPDVFVESLPYYAANPTFLLRQQRFGAVTHFTRKAIVHLTLGRLLATARRLRVATGRPVVILMARPLGSGDGEQQWSEGMLGDMTARAGEVAAFRAATRRIAAPIELIRQGAFDERYDVYLLVPA